MKDSAHFARFHRIVKVSAILALAALCQGCPPPCLKSLPTPSARRGAARAGASLPGFDLVANPNAGAGDTHDLNGYLKNPIWQYQAGTDNNNPAGNYALKDAEDTEFNCFTGDRWFTDARCTSQQPRCDLPTNLFRNLICTIGNTKFNGHMNWYPATYEGAFFWDQLATDSDLDFLFYSSKLAGMTQASCDQRQGAIGVEFDSREVVDEIRTINDATFWWRRFLAAVDRQEEGSASGTPTGVNSTPIQLIDGKFAILTGLVGLDCEHGCTAELHPVWALALHAEDRPDDDQWSIFVRNWGNEGFCSAQQHYLTLPANQYKLRLPWRRGASSVEVLTGRSSYCQNFNLAPGAPAQPAASVSVTFTPGEALFVTFTLPDPKQHRFVLGDLHLKWVDGQTEPVHPLVPRDPAARCQTALARRPARTNLPKAGDERLEELINEMTPEQRQKYRQALESARRTAAAREQMICTPFGIAQSVPAAPSPPPVTATLGQVTHERLATQPRDPRSEAICTALGAQAKSVGEKIKVAKLDKACKQLLKY